MRDSQPPKGPAAHKASPRQSTTATSEAESMPADNGELHFEQALARLEQLVSAMESGNLSLEESLASFEQGIQLTRTCQQALQAAEQRVQILMENSASAPLQPLE